LANSLTNHRAAHLILVRSGLRTGGLGRIIDSERTAVDLLALKELHGLLRTIDIDEIGVSESSWLASAAVNSDTDIDDIADVAEELVEICVGHLEREVADEESLGWHGLGGLAARSLCAVVDNETAAAGVGLVLCCNGGGGGWDVFEFNITESGGC
jgi:hypothetical protein